MAKYRVWWNRKPDMPFPKPDSNANKWVVEEGTAAIFADSVRIQTGVSFVKGPEGSTPQGWAECEGQASMDGTTNTVVIRGT